MTGDQKIRNEEKTVYYVDLVNRNGSASCYHTRVSCVSEHYVEWLEKHPDELNLTIAVFGLDPNICQIIVCRDDEEKNRLLSMGGHWCVKRLYKEIEYTRIQSTVIAESTENQ
jgi:hypothetical protein